MSNYNISKTVDSLLKIAQDMSDMTEQHAQAKATPEQVLEGLSAVISELQAITESLPVQGAPEQAPPQEAPVAPEESESEKKIAKLTSELEELRQKEAKREREEIATKIAELYPESEQQSKFDSLMKSEVDVTVLKAKLEALSDFSETATKQAKVNTFSYTKTAKQFKSKEGRLLTI